MRSRISTSAEKRQALGPEYRPPGRLIHALVILFCLSWSSPYSQENPAGPKEFRLPNGLGVDAGVKDESPETNGLAHVLEHYLLLRGDPSRFAPEARLDLQGHGAYLNGRTGQDITLFEVSLPFEFAEFGLRSLKETVFDLKLDGAELDKEKKVILEEISQVEDDPVKLAMALVYENLFKGHPYGTPLFGRKEVVEALTVKQLEDFHRRLYVSSNCVLAVVGDFKTDEMEERVKSVFGEIPAGNASSFRPEKALKPDKPIDLERTLDIQETYLVVGLPGPDFNHPEQYAMDVLTEILGRGMTPLLYTALRGRRDLIQTISMGYSAFRAGGAVVIIFTLDPKNVKAARRELLDYLKTTRTGMFSKEDYFGDAELYAFDYLESAKNQIRYKSEVAQETALDLALSVASYMLLNEIASRGGYLEAIGKLKSGDLRKAAESYLSRGNAVIVSIMPAKKIK
jgi:zinc protease